MGVDSYLEIFTTLYGWYFSSVIVRVLFMTGLFLVPIFFAIVGTFLESYADGLDGNGAKYLVRKLEVTLYVSLFMILFAVAPTNLTSLNRLDLHYTPPATTLQPSPERVTGADTGSTYDSQFGGSTDVAAVPVWWYLSMGVSSGVSAAVRGELKSVSAIADLRLLKDIAARARITDPELRSDIQRFYADCFTPARSRFLRTLPPSPQASEAMDKYGKDDVEWIGSHVFQEDPEFYARYWASQPVRGFVVDLGRGTDADRNPWEPEAEWGRPSCQQWWAEPDIGLRARMVDHVGMPIGSGLELGTALVNMWPLSSSEERADAIARLAYMKEQPRFVDPEAILGSDRKWWNDAAAAPAETLGILGTFWEGLKVNASMMPIINLMLMVQTLILFGIYLFLPTVVIFSGYSPRIFVMGALAIFTVKFWSVMWWICRWMDDHLIQALEESGPGSFMNIGDIAFVHVMLNALLVLMFIGLPLLWTGMMAWAGLRLGGLVDGLSTANQMGIAAGASGTNMATRKR